MRRVEKIESQRISRRTVAVGGIFLALSIVTLFLATIIPGIELTLYALSSFYVAFMVIETKARSGWLFYAASVLLSAMLVPNKAGLLPYAMFFGLYPMIKYYIERQRRNSRWLEIFLKLIFFNLTLGAALLFLRQLFFSTINLPNLALPLLIAAGQVGFLFYDYFFTVVVGFYLRRRQRIL